MNDTLDNDYDEGNIVYKEEGNVIDMASENMGTRCMDMDNNVLRRYIPTSSEVSFNPIPESSEVTYIPSSPKKLKTENNEKSRQEPVLVQVKIEGEESRKSFKKIQKKKESLRKSERNIDLPVAATRQQRGKRHVKRSPMG